MCLTNISKQKIAERDISCYKFFDTLPKYSFFGLNFGKMIISPYRRAEYKLKQLYDSHLYPSSSGWPVSVDEINVGLHSFKFKLDATIFARSRADYAETDYSKFLIANCVIPKGSRYFEGSFDVFPSIASNAIIVEDVITLKKAIEYQQDR